MIMAEKRMDPVPEEIPSPEELFHADEGSEKQRKPLPSSYHQRKPIPQYKVVKRFSAGFLVILLLVIIGAANLDRLGIHFYCMGSSSMESVIPKDSFLVVRSVKADELKEGDIITFVNANHMSVTHEIIEVILDYNSGPGYRTKGTENEECDQYITSYQDVIGKVVFHIPYVGKWMTVWK